MKLTPRGEAFRKKYMAEFKEDPIYGALNGYSQVVLLADALNAAKSDKTDDLQYAFFNGVGYESWENIWGIWNQITPRDAEALRRVAAIERAALAQSRVVQGLRPHRKRDLGVAAVGVPP